jgi:hypothetical protein
MSLVKYEQGFISQTTSLFIVRAVRTSRLTNISLVNLFNILIFLLVT